MYFYFSGEYPSAIKIGGIYFGQIYPDVKSIDIDLSTPTLIEICPLKKNEPPTTFILSENFPQDFDAHASVTDLDGGFFIKFKKCGKNDEMFVLAQEKFPDLAVSVFNQSGLKISVETRGDFFAEDLSGEFSSATIKKFILDDKELLCVCLLGEEDKCLLIYDFSDKIKRLYYDKVSDFSLENGFETQIQFKDILKHTVKTVWQYSDGALKEKEKKITAKKAFTPYDYHEKIIPYIFMEELLIGGNVIPFLSEDLKPDADKLPAFFEGVIGIMPPPLFKDSSLLGLIYKENEDRYKVRYLEISLTDKHVSDIKIT